MNELPTKDGNLSVEEGGINTLPAKAEAEKEIVFVEVPVYSPQMPETQSLAGRSAVKKAFGEQTQVPEYAGGRIRRYSFHPDFVYEVHCQTYHLTDIELMPGETVLETPYISEPDVWQIAAGESVKDGMKVPHFFVKPDYPGQVCNMVIVTDLHVYHLELKSFRDYYMPVVRWTYPLQSAKRIQEQREAAKAMQQEEAKKAIEAEQKQKETFEYFSFNYKLKKGLFTKVPWEPKQVYDDGRRTYIVVDETALHQELPALFNAKNEIVNYRVDKNVLIADQLITKMTLKLGKKKITIVKKK
jgi:type IV secretion system protein VirB9